MCDISEYFYLSAGVHASSLCKQCSTETSAFILPTLWPPNSPDLNPVDYKVWSVLQEQVYNVKVNNVDELRQRKKTVSRLSGMNLTSIFLTRRSSSAAPA